MLRMDTRLQDHGVIQIDNGELVGGGIKADLTSNATLALYNLLLDSHSHRRSDISAEVRLR